MDVACCQSLCQGQQSSSLDHSWITSSSWNHSPADCWRREWSSCYCMGCGNGLKKIQTFLKASSQNTSTKNHSWKQNITVASSCCIRTTTVEPLIKDPPKKGQPPNKGRNSEPLSHSSSSFLTSEKRTTSQQRTKWLVPKCPLFGGSTV